MKKVGALFRYISWVEIFIRINLKGKCKNRKKKPITLETRKKRGEKAAKKKQGVRQTYEEDRLCGVCGRGVGEGWFVT